MTVYRFTDAIARTYHAPSIGEVQPDELRVFDDAPPNDGRWEPVEPVATEDDSE